MHLPDHLQQLTHDRQQARQASAAAHRFVGSSPARIRIARTLRRAADRLDAATSPSAVRSAHPGGSSQLPPGAQCRLEESASTTDFARSEPAMSAIPCSGPGSTSSCLSADLVAACIASASCEKSKPALSSASAAR